jgi:uncharacterized membrane protein YgcG
MNLPGPPFSKKMSIGDNPTTPSNASSVRSCLADVAIADGFPGFPTDVEVEGDFSNIRFEQFNMSKFRWRGLGAEKLTQSTARMDTVEVGKGYTKTGAQNIWPAQEKDGTISTVEDLEEAPDEAPEEAEEEWFLLLMKVCELLLVFMWEEKPKRGPGEVAEVQPLLMSVLNVAGIQFGFTVRPANCDKLLVREGHMFGITTSGFSDLFLEWVFDSERRVLAAVIEVKVKFCEWRFFPQTIAEVFGAIASASEEWRLPDDFSKASIPRALLFNGTMLARILVDSHEQATCDIRPLSACRPLWEFLCKLQKEAASPQRQSLSASSPFINYGGGGGGRGDGECGAGETGGGGSGGGGKGDGGEGEYGRGGGGAGRRGGGGDRGDTAGRDDSGGVAKAIQFNLGPRAPLQMIDTNIDTTTRHCYLNASNLDRWNHGQPLEDYRA